MKVDDKKIQESFSAWLDDESDDLDMQRLVSYLKSGSNVEIDSALKKQAQVKNVLNGWGECDISDAVQQEITPSVQLFVAKSPLSKWQVIKNSPWSLVASFTLLIAVSVPVIQQGDWIQDQLVTRAVQQQEMVTHTEILANSQSRLNKYLQKHLKQASLTSGHVNLPYQTIPVLGS